MLYHRNHGVSGQAWPLAWIGKVQCGGSSRAVSFVRSAVLVSGVGIMAQPTWLRRLAIPRDADRPTDDRGDEEPVSCLSGPAVAEFPDLATTNRKSVRIPTSARLERHG